MLTTHDRPPSIICCPTPGSPVTLVTGNGGTTTNPTPTQPLPTCKFGRLGSCIDTRAMACTGANLISNECDGDASIRCCPSPGFPTKKGTTASECTKQYSNAQCWDSTQKKCSIAYRAGLCPGNAAMQCCPSGQEHTTTKATPKPTPAPTPAPTTTKPITTTTKKTTPPTQRRTTTTKRVVVDPICGGAFSLVDVCPKGKVCVDGGTTNARCVDAENDCERQYTNGQCWDVSQKECSVASVKGLCQGSVNIRCCPSGTTNAAPPTQCAQTFPSGMCLDDRVNTCTIAFRSGLCPSHANNRCCPSGKARVITTATTPTAAAGTASKPLSSPAPALTTQQHMIATTKFVDTVAQCLNGKAGKCIDTNAEQCTGADLLSGACPGGSNIMCCPDPGRPEGKQWPGDGGPDTCGTGGFTGRKISTLMALQPEFRAKIQELMAKLAQIEKAVEYNFKVYESLRKIPDECGLANPSVSKADPCKNPSKHAYGGAVDIVPHGTWEGPWRKASWEGWNALRTAAHEVGLDNDISWDRPHVDVSRSEIIKWLQKDLGLVQVRPWPRAGKGVPSATYPIIIRWFLIQIA